MNFLPVNTTYAGLLMGGVRTPPFSLRARGADSRSFGRVGRSSARSIASLLVPIYEPTVDEVEFGAGRPTLRATLSVVTGEFHSNMA